MLYSQRNSNPHEVAPLIRRKQDQGARRYREIRSESPTQLLEETDDRHTLEFDEDHRHMAVGSDVWDLAGGETPKELLSEYLAFVYSMRGLQPGTPVHVNRNDLEVLEAAIGWPTDRISGYLVDLILDQSSSRTVQPTSRAKEKTRDTLEDIVDWWHG
jgi:hypothetical protein